MKLIITALRIMERESRKLRQQCEKGKIPEWKDVKLILQALGALAEDAQIQAEAEKKSMWYKVGLATFAAFTRSL